MDFKNTNNVRVVKSGEDLGALEEGLAPFFSPFEIFTEAADDNDPFAGITCNVDRRDTT